MAQAFWLQVQAWQCCWLQQTKLVLVQRAFWQGLVTLEDIIEEMIGEFTTSTPAAARADNVSWDQNGTCLLEGSTTLRDINKQLELQFALDGPKTINGLLLEYLQDIPEASVCLKINDCVIEIVQVKNQSIKVVKLIRPLPVTRSTGRSG